MRRRIHLHGALKEIHPEPIEVDTATVAEAIELITRQLPGFAPNALDGRKEIQVAGFNTHESLFAPTEVTDLHFFPPLVFGKNGGLLKTIIGFALVVVSFFIPPAAAILSMLIAPVIFSIGVSLVIGGLAQLLSPQPHDTLENRSKYLANNQNTVRIGTPVGILYGKRRVAGQILSLNVQSQDA